MSCSSGRSRGTCRRRRRAGHGRSCAKACCERGRRNGCRHLRAAFQLDARVFCALPRHRARWGLPRGRRRRRGASRRPRAHARRHRGRRGARGQAHASLAAPPRPPRRARSRRPLERSARALAARSVHADVPLRKHLRAPRGRRRASAAREKGGSLWRSGQGPVGGGSVGVQPACRRHGERWRPRRTRTFVPLRRAAAVQLGALARSLPTAAWRISFASRGATARRTS